MDFAILQSGLNLSDYRLCPFAAWLESLRRSRCVASLPIESRPCFPRMASQRSGSSSPSKGDHYNSEKTGASCWSPCTRYMDGAFGLRAEDAAPRIFARRDSGRPIRVRTRREVRPADPALCPLRCNLAEELIRASTNRPARSALSQHAVTLPASRFASNSIAPQAARASPGTASAPSSVPRPVRRYAPGLTHGNRTRAKRVVLLNDVFI